MSTLDGMLTKRPIDPEEMARLQAEVHQEIADFQRERLARVLYIQANPTPSYIDARTKAWDTGEVHEYMTHEAYRLADAILEHFEVKEKS